MKSLLPLSLLATLFLCACASFTKVGPLRGPEAGAHWRVPDGFKLAEPAADRIPAEWWKIYHDEDLDRLEEQVVQHNQTLAQADAQYRLAAATTASVQSSLYPTVTANFNGTRSQSPILTTTGLARPAASNLFNLNLQASWEPDLWGAVHANILSAQASDQAAFASRGAALLSLQATLASDYFQLRVADATLHLLDETVAAYQKSLDLTRMRDHSGVAARSDVTQATSQLESARAAQSDQRLVRDTLEHAIAVLTGRSASDFSLAPRAWEAPDWPALPLGIPSALLERRPDIATAERQVASATAKLTAAEGAFYPVVTLSTELGFESRQLGNLVNLPKSFWSLGPSLTQYLFDGGNHTAVRDEALATIDQTTANYREVVLEAFQSVEDSVSGVLLLAEEESRQRANAKAARETLALVEEQYRSGVVGYLNVISAQTVLLSAETSVLGLQSRKAQAHVLLVKALGGGWEGMAEASPDSRRRSPASPAQ